MGQVMKGQLKNDKTGVQQSLICPHLHPVQHSPDQRGNARCGLFVVMRYALQHHLICPVNQLSHRAVETSETGGDGLTAERTDGDESGHRSLRFRSNLNRCHLPVLQVWLQLDQSLDCLQDATGCPA